MRIAVCTLYTPELDSFARYTVMNFRSYCNRHRYDFILSNTTLDPSRSPHWSKIILLQQFIDKYDWLMWIDADAAITNKDIKIESLIDNEYDIIIAREELGFQVINTGVFIIKNSEQSKNFLSRWYGQNWLNARFWDQSGFIQLYDSDPEIKSRIKIVKQKLLNSWPGRSSSDVGNFSDGDFIVHFYGISDRKPLRKYSYYKDPNYVSTRDKIPELLNKLNLSGAGIEIGVERGLYAECILSKSKLQKLYLCDLDNYNDIANVEDHIHEQNLVDTIVRLHPFRDRTEILRMLSQDATNNFLNDSLDFVYIDGNHAYKYVLKDIKNWYPKIRKGGIIAGHDFLDGNIQQGEFGVRQAVTEFFVYAPCIYITDEDWPSWYVIKY